MNWIAISAIAEVFGVIAIVISLLYVALQIRFARLAAADATRTARATGVRELDLAMVDNRELRENWLTSSDLIPAYKELGSTMDLTQEQALQVDTLCQSWMRLHWGQHKSITTREDLRDLEQLVGAFYSVPPMLHCWNGSPYGKRVFDADFAKFVDSAIEKTSRKSASR